MHVPWLAVKGAFAHRITVCAEHMCFAQVVVVGCAHGNIMTSWVPWGVEHPWYAPAIGYNKLAAPIHGY